MASLEQAAVQTLASHTWWESFVVDTRRDDRHERAAELFEKAATRYTDKNDKARCARLAFDASPTPKRGVAAFRQTIADDVDAAVILLEKISVSNDTRAKFRQQIAQRFALYGKLDIAVKHYIIAASTHQSSARRQACLIHAAHLYTKLLKWEPAARLYEQAADLTIDDAALCRALFCCGLSWYKYGSKHFNSWLSSIERSVFLSSRQYRILQKMSPRDWIDPVDIPIIID